MLTALHNCRDVAALLAYFFLWRGQANPLPMDSRALDFEIEEWLQSKSDEYGLTSIMKFQVDDGLRKLLQLGLATVVPYATDGGTPLYQVDCAW